MRPLILAAALLAATPALAALPTPPKPPGAGRPAAPPSVRLPGPDPAVAGLSAALNQEAEAGAAMLANAQVQAQRREAALRAQIAALRAQLAAKARTKPATP